MNPMTNIKNVLKLSEQELRSSMKTSWHDQYKHSAWLFVGGLPYDLTEGDIICVFSQYGEVVNVNLVRDKGTGKSKGFCFLCYEDQRSTNLAVDNFNGIKLLNRTIRVDHCENYKAPKDDKMDEESQQLHAEGCAPGSKFGHAPQLPSSSGSNGGLDKGLNLPPMDSLLKIKSEKDDSSKKPKEKERKEKKERKGTRTKDEVKKIFKKKKKESSSSSSSSEDSSSDSDEPKSKKKKSVKKSKQRKQASSSSSEDSEAENRKYIKKGEKIPKKSAKYNSSESDSERKVSNKSEAKEERGSSSRHKDYDIRSSQGDSRNMSKWDHFDRSTDIRPSGRQEGKDRPVVQRGFKESDKARGDSSYGWTDRNRSEKREDSRKHEIERRSRDERPDVDRFKEDKRSYDNERRRRDYGGENEHYRKRESGGRH